MWLRPHSICTNSAVGVHGSIRHSLHICAVCNKQIVPQKQGCTKTCFTKTHVQSWYRGKWSYNQLMQTLKPLRTFDEWTLLSIYLWLTYFTSCPVVSWHACTDVTVDLIRICSAVDTGIAQAFDPICAIVVYMYLGAFCLIFLSFSTGLFWRITEEYIEKINFFKSKILRHLLFVNVNSLNIWSIYLGKVSQICMWCRLARGSNTFNA